MSTPGPPLSGRFGAHERCAHANADASFASPSKVLSTGTRPYSTFAYCSSGSNVFHTQCAVHAHPRRPRRNLRRTHYMSMWSAARVLAHALARAPRPSFSCSMEVARTSPDAPRAPVRGAPACPRRAHARPRRAIACPRRVPTWGVLWIRHRTRRGTSPHARPLATRKRSTRRAPASSTWLVPAHVLCPLSSRSMGGAQTSQYARPFATAERSLRRPSSRRLRWLRAQSFVNQLICRVTLELNEGRFAARTACTHPFAVQRRSSWCTSWRRS
jgi:hypothetical protein